MENEIYQKKSVEMALKESRGFEKKKKKKAGMNFIFDYFTLNDICLCASKVHVNFSICILYCENYETGSYDYSDYVTEPSMRFTSKGASVDRIPWQHRGGLGRDHNTLMELQLTKVIQIH